MSFLGVPVGAQLTGTVVVANKGEATASFIDVETARFFDGDDYTELGRIPFPGEGPQGLVLHPDGRHLFLSLSAAGRIAIVDIEAREVVGYLPAGLGPDGIGYSALSR
jgi:DNA-binding beta-propeller fold protein YncE